MEKERSTNGGESATGRGEIALSFLNEQIKRVHEVLFEVHGQVIDFYS